MTSSTPTAHSALIDLAVELNELPTLEQALPVLVERLLELTGAASASVMTWDGALTEARVCAAAGVAADRVGWTVSREDSIPVQAIRTGAPQSGEVSVPGLRAGLSVPIVRGETPVTVQVAWTDEPSEAELEEATDLLIRLARLTAIGGRTDLERRRRDEQALLQAVLEAAGDGILVVRDGRWLANAAARRLLALPDERLPSAEELHARHLDGRSIASGETLAERFRARVRSLAGDELVLDGSCSLEPVPVIVFRDVTEEYRREYANEQYLEALLDTISTAICVPEAGTRRILSANRAFLELVGRSADEVVGVVPPYPWWDEGEHLLDLSNGHRYRRTYRHADGRVVPVELETRDLVDADGRVTAHIGVVTDLSERRRFEQQLVQSGKLAAIGELAAGVAHEINNPLFAILGLSEFLLAEHEPGTKARERVELIRQTGLEIKEIVRALLDFARESSDERLVVGLDDVVRETVELVRRTSSSRGIEIEESVGRGPFLVQASSNQLKQIFLNLLANARHAMPGGGSIRIRLERDRGFVVATVADDGHGVPPELLGRIFEPFFTTRRGSGGTGLGLSVSVGIAESHGGTLTAASEPGAGAVFTLRLPEAAP